MKVTLVFPGITGSGWHSIGKTMDDGWISHGLCILSACLKREGHEVNLLDLRALKDWGDFSSQLLIRRPDVVGITMMSCDWTNAIAAARIAKAILPKSIVCMGGCHPSIQPEDVTPEKAIDYIFVGEAELTFPWALAHHKYKEVPRVIVTQEDQRPNLDDLPFTDRTLFSKEWADRGFVMGPWETPFAGLPAPFATIIAGRGCIYNCSFCQPAERFIFGHKVRRRSPQNVVTELCELKGRGLASYLIHDDCLTEDTDWVERFSACLTYANIHLPFLCQSRADIIVKNITMVERMKDAGLTGMLVGFESGNDRVLKFLRKGTTREQNLAAGRVLKSLGIKVWANFMLGIPGESKEEMLDTASMILELQPDIISPAIYTPAPGSDLFAYCEKNNLLQVQTHAQLRRNFGGRPLKDVDYDWIYGFLWPRIMGGRKQ